MKWIFKRAFSVHTDFMTVTLLLELLSSMDTFL